LPGPVREHDFDLVTPLKPDKLAEEKRRLGKARVALDYSVPRGPWHRPFLVPTGIPQILGVVHHPLAVDPDRLDRTMDVYGWDEDHGWLGSWYARLWRRRWERESHPDVCWICVTCDGSGKCHWRDDREDS
jgi:hypothetical protein